MDPMIWRDVAPGVRALHLEVGAWALSPDGQYLAAADALPNALGECSLWCLEAESGRVVFEKRGAPVKAIAWPGSESLAVFRAQDRSVTRAILHAVPDGGVLGSERLDWLPGSRVRVSMAPAAGLLLAVPWRMDALPRSDARRRVAHLLRADTMAPVSAWDPDEDDRLRGWPVVRACAVSLSPDGHRLAVWYGADEGPGTLMLRDLAATRGQPVCPVGSLVDDITWIDADTLLLRRSWGEEPGAPGHLDVAKLSTREVRYTSREESPPDGWVGGASDIDLAPDRAHLLVAGRVKSDNPRRSQWNAVLRAVSVADGSVTVPRVIATNVDAAWGAAWLPDDAGIALLRAKTKTAAVAEVVRIRSIDAEPGPGRLELPFSGRNPRGGRLARSPCSRWLVAHWRVAPQDRKRSEVGAITSTRLCLLDAGVLVT